MKTTKPARKRYTINNPAYRFYVVLPGHRIESGWEYRSDAVDHLNDNRGAHCADARIMSLVTLRSFGIDPKDNATWLTSVELLVGGSR